nr:caldesmon-like [Quercus suber]
MDSYRRFSQYELFMSLKRDLAMITQQVFVAEEWNRKTHVEAQAEAQARSEAERALDSLKGEISKLSEQLKGVAQERDSLDAGLKNAESQAESQRRQLSEAQKNLAAERETTKALHAELLKAKKAAEEAQRDAQLAKEATEAEKRASYQLGVETTEKGPNQEESVGSQRQDHFLNLERRRDREVSIHTTQTSNSQSRSKSHVFYEENTRSIQFKIDHLRKRLRREQRRKTPSSFDPSFEDNGDGSYRPRSRTPPSESFSYDKDRHYKRRSKSPSHKGVGNNAMNMALNQISKSPFTPKIERGKLPR